MLAPSYFGFVAPFSDEVTENPLLFYTHRLVLVEFRCCSNVVAEPPWPFTLENILELMKFRSIWSWKKTMAGQGDHPRWMLVISEQGERQQQQLTALMGTDPRCLKSSVLSLDLQGSFSSRNVHPWFVLVFFFSLQFTAYMKLPLQVKSRSTRSSPLTVTSTHNSEKFPVLI